MAWLSNLRLKSGNPGVRAKALEGLQGPGDSATVKLVLASLRDPDAAVRCAAVKALERVNDENSGVCLIAMLKDPASQVRQAAATVLGKLKDTRSCDSLALLLNDSVHEVRCSVAAALRKLGWRPSNSEQQVLFDIATGNARAALRGGDVAVQSLVKELKHDTSFVRRAVAEALEHVDDPRTTKPLLDALADEDPTVRVSVIHALSKAAAQPTACALLGRLVQDKDHRVRLAAAEVLSKLNDPDQVPWFLGLLEDDHFEVRIAALQFLGRMAEPQLAEAVAALLKDPDGDVRQAAAQALGSLGNSIALESLAMALADEDHGVRLAAQRALDMIDSNWLNSDAGARARTELENLMNDRSPWVRATITQALAKAPTPDDPLNTV